MVSDPPWVLGFFLRLCSHKVRVCVWVIGIKWFCVNNTHLRRSRPSSIVAFCRNTLWVGFMRWRNRHAWVRGSAWEVRFVLHHLGLSWFLIFGSFVPLVPSKYTWVRLFGKYPFLLLGFVVGLLVCCVFSPHFRFYSFSLLFCLWDINRALVHNGWGEANGSI